MKCLSSVVRFATLGLLLAAGQASANITYSFSGAAFSDGGSLTGSFTTNDAINALVSASITTSPAAGGFGLTYTLANSTSFSALPTILVFDSPAGTTDNILQVTFNPSLSATGAPIRIGQFDSFEQHLALPHRTLVSGSAVIGAIPEPETYAIMLAGLGVLGFAARRRKYKAA